MKIPILLYFGATSVIYFWKYFHVFGVDFNLPTVINLDDLCQANRAMYLNNFGIETTNINYLNPINGIEPFHYMEAWIIAFCQFFSSLNYWLVTQLIVYPILSGIIICGVWSVIERFTENKKIYFLAFLAPILSGFFFHPIKEISFFEFTQQFGQNALDEHWGLKLSIVYILILSFINLKISKLDKISFYLLFLLPIFSITLAPGVLTSLFVLLLINKIFKIDIIGFKTTYLDIFLPLFVGMGIIVSYKIFQPDQVHVGLPNNYNDILNEFNSLSAIKTKIIVAVEKIIQLCVLYFPFLFLMFAAIKILMSRGKNHNNELLFVFIMLLTIVLCSFPFMHIFRFIFGSSEFFYYPSIPILNLLSLISIIYLLVNLESLVLKRLIISFSFISFIIFALRSESRFILHSRKHGSIKYSSEYLENVKSEVDKMNNILGAKIESPNEMYFSDSFDGIGYYIMGLTNRPYSLVSVSRTPYIEYTDKSIEKFSKLSDFYQYLESKPLANGGNIEENQISFIKENNIKFIIVCGTCDIPESLKKITKKEYSDYKTKEKFLLLK